MKKYIFLSLFIGLLISFCSTQASAQRRKFGPAASDSSSIAQRQAVRQQMKARYDSLSPDQQKAIREKMRSRMDTLSPDKKKEMRKELRAKFKDMSPEERKQLRKDFMNRADSSGAMPRRKRGQTDNS